jgi:hydrogenase maturation protease
MLHVSRPSSILVLGLGNPILGDDGVGWKVIERLSAILDPYTSIETDCISLGGLSLMERVLGYGYVILIDSMETGQGTEGSVSVFPLEALSESMSGHSASAHDTSLLTALQTAKALGSDTPSRIDIVAIEAKQVHDFSENLSPAVARAVTIAAEKVLDLLKEEMV